MPIEFSQNSTARLYQTLCVVTSIIVMCFGSSAQQSSEEVKTGTISGRVVNENGQPLVGATVSISQAGTVSSGRSTISNLEGKFQVNGLENALYYVSANSPAYVTAPVDLETPYPTYRVGDSVRLELIRGGVITGTVTNATGDPVLGVRVRAFMVRDATGKPIKVLMNSLAERSTDDRGIYRIYGLAPGSYLVRAGGGGALGILSATELDAPTYAPSSTRDTAVEIQVRAGEDATVDIRYRSEPGHVISGQVKMQGTFGASVTLVRVGDGLIPTSSSFQRAAGQGFALSGIADGEYELTAQEVTSSRTMAFPDFAISDPIRVTVKGADVTGLEVIPKPLASVTGKVTLEPSKLPECQNKRQPLFSETMVTLLQNRKEQHTYQVWSFRSFLGNAIPDKDGAFIIKNVRAGQYSFSPHFFARYWYLKSITLSASQTNSGQVKASSSLNPDIGRTWATLKSGDRLTGLTISLAEGAASIRGQITKSEDAKMSDGLRVFLVPSERDKVNDPLRYFTNEVNGDGTFLFDQLAAWSLLGSCSTVAS